MERIFFFLAFVLVIGVGLYFYQTGALQKNISSFTSFVSPASSTRSIFGTGGLFGPTSPKAPPVVGGGSSSGSPNEQPVNPSDLPPGFAASQVSPYYHQFRVSGSPGPFGTISISDSLQNNETVDVTGWQIRTNRGGEFIPQAVNVYSPFGTAMPSDIRMGSADTLTIYPNSSPTNLRINKCIGYLNDTNQWSPALPSYCPSINTSEIQSFTGACQNYILSLGGCSTANLGDPRIPRNDFSCQDYISSHFSYRSCFDAHVGDSDFLSHQIWVWAGSNPLDQFHDRVMLIDAKGLLVDYYVY